MLTGASAWKHRQIEVTLVSPPVQTAKFERALGNHDALKEYRENPDLAWARRFDVQEPDTFGTLFERLGESDLVVGFEMAPTIKRKLHTQRRPYVNFYIHPMRFLRDLCFGATTNTPMIAAALRLHEIAQHEIEYQIRRFRAMFLRQQRTAFSLPSGLPILVGQTERDSVLIRNGRFVGWEDYADELADKLKRFDEIAFLEHPYRPKNAITLEYLRSVHRKTVISTNANSYGVLFSNRNVPEVLTLASSLGVEAESMGLPATFLLSDPRKGLMLSGIDVQEHGSYGHAVLGQSFWDMLLCAAPSKRRKAGAIPRDDFFLGPNYIRKTLDAWSFQQLEGDVGNLPCRKTLLPSEILDDQRRGALLAEMFSEGTPLSPQAARPKARAMGIELYLLDSPLGIGERREIALDGPMANHYLAQGFHPCESWGAWSSEFRSELVIAVTTEVALKFASVTVTLRLHVLQDLMPRAPVIRVSCEGELIGYVFFRRSARSQQIIQFVVKPKSTQCRIRLESTDLGTPATTASSFDDRTLGFGLTQLALACEVQSSGNIPSSNATSYHLWGVAGSENENIESSA
jgi:hypothetical protein